MVVIPQAVDFSEDTSGLTGCNSTGVIVRTFTATDGSGNTSDYMQMISVVPLAFSIFDIERSGGTDFALNALLTLEADRANGQTG